MTPNTPHSPGSDTPGSDTRGPHTPGSDTRGPHTPGSGTPGTPVQPPSDTPHHTPADAAHSSPPPAPPAPGTPPDEETTAFRALLRGLPAPERERPPFAPDPAQAPAEPLPLFRQWLRQAADAGVPEPHAATLATSDADGLPVSRVLMLHDADARGWHFASDRTSRKGRELAARPYGALCFYWSKLGRQVRLRGPVTVTGPEECAADLRGRSAGGLAAALVGRQSQVLSSYRELTRASSAAWEQALREPDAPVPTWARYVLRPQEVEFYQLDDRRRHVRLCYHHPTTDAAGNRTWRRDLLWP